MGLFFREFTDTVAESEQTFVYVFTFSSGGNGNWQGGREGGRMIIWDFVGKYGELDWMVRFFVYRFMEYLCIL